MLARFSLLLIALAGVSILLFPALKEHLPARTDSSTYALWLAQLRAFGIPLTLLILSFMKGKFVVFCRIGWAIWFGGLSLALLWQAEEISPYVSTYGFLFIAAMTVLSLTLMLFSVMGLLKK